MTDQIPADKVRKITDAMRAAIRRRRDTPAYSNVAFLADMAQYTRDLESLVSAPPTSWSLYWLTGDRQVVEGEQIHIAMNNAGIGAGALAALDFYKKGAEDHGYRWSPDDRRWVKGEA